MLICTNCGDGTHKFLGCLTRPGRRLVCCVGFVITDDIRGAILKIPACALTPAYGGNSKCGQEHVWPSSPACWTCPPSPRYTGDRPQGTPHPGVQLCFTDIDGHRFTCFATATKGGSSPTEAAPLRGNFNLRAPPRQQP